MSKTGFYRIGHCIYRLRWFLIVLWVVIILACLPFTPNLISPFKTTGFVDESSESAKAENILNEQLGFDRDNTFILIYHSKTLKATDPLFIHEIKQSLAQLKKFPIKHNIIMPDAQNRQISKDKHTAYVLVILKRIPDISMESVTQFKSLIKKPSQMRLLFGGQPIFEHEVNKQTQVDLYKADYIATPITLMTLLVIFGSVVAATLPIVLGGGCALMLLTLLYLLGHVFTLSIFTLNIALLLGLCLSLDYSLLMISRFREELSKKVSVPDAVAMTLSTAGKAIFFSGIAVLVSLSALFIFPVNILFSVAVGGLSAVVFAMLTSIIFLPSMLSVIHHRINLFSIWRVPRHQKGKASFWHWMANKIVQHPYGYGILILIVLLLLGYPLTFAKFGVSDFHIFPEHSEHRQFYDMYSKQFNERELDPILLTIQSKKPLTTHKNLTTIYHFAQRLEKNHMIKRVDSIVTTEPSLNNHQYYQLYHESQDQMSPTVKQLLDTSTRSHFTVFSIISQNHPNSDQSNTLIKKLRTLRAGHGLEVALTGLPVTNMDVLDSITDKVPYAVAWILISTYIILLILLRSLFLPLKAIIMNLLSLSACYGALVLVFQEGHLHHLLMFQPQGMLDISMLVIIFCALFGFSMDYEVFLLTRIKEFYDVTHNNRKSIVVGIQKSSRIITSAALIVIFICGSFLVADILMVKAFGLGIAVAIFVDAFLIRTIFVPSTMMLLGRWNWYLPKWLDRILPKL